MIVSAVIGLILFVGCITLYRTFALYEEKKEFNVLKGRVPDFKESDIIIAFTINGEKTDSSFPSKGIYVANGVSCKNQVTAEWSDTSWGLMNINNPENAKKIECTIDFVGGESFDFGNKHIVSSDLVRDKHDNVRYIGKDPNNYVTFNNETWRIIGYMNVPEGKRVKLIRKDSIGAYVWDTSETAINQGGGINEWSQADIKTLLNSGAYYNRTSGTCYTGIHNATASCNFSNKGLTAEAKTMIDTVTWNTGAGNSSTQPITEDFYNMERSSNNGKICSTSDGCNDTVSRKTSWKGQVGLMYPSDYGYATSGGATTNRATCLSTALTKWNQEEVSDCKNNNWLFTGKIQLTITPMQHGKFSTYEAHIYNDGNVGNGDGWNNPEAVHPVVYLKTDVKVASGTGSSSNPYILTK